MTDYTDPESPIADPHAVERPQWTPIYMGEGHPYRCINCDKTRGSHERNTNGLLYCYESFLRLKDGNR